MQHFNFCFNEDILSLKGSRYDTCIILSSQEELDQDLLKVVRYEFHTFRYHTLLEVIFGLNGALRHLMKVN